MRKNQVLVVAVALLFCSAVAVQAQGVYEVFSNPVKARAGGARENAGDVVLFLRTGMHAAGVVTVTFSAPVAEGLDVSGDGIVVSGGANAVVNVEKGTVTITMPASGDGSVTLSGVRLDVREAEAPVTAMFSGNSDAFLSGAANVISSIDDALEVASTTKALLTRGDMGMATVTIKEAFASAFTVNANVMLRISGVPDKATLSVMHVQPEDPTAANDDADVGGNVTLNTDTMIVTAGDTTSDELTLTGDGKDIDITIGFTDPVAATAESLSLMLDLDARSTVMDIKLPLGAGMVQVMATMAPTKKPPTVATDSEYFAENLIAAEKPSFTFAPASCTMLFPYVISLPNLDPAWNTGLAITNPTAMGSSPLDGAVTFTLFMNGGDAEMPMTYSTGAGTPGPNALDDEGMLPAGNTYTLLLSELLAWVGHEGDFTGHLYVKTDFTGCRGLGWVTNFSTVNQAYLPYFRADDADLGAIPAN